MTVLLVFRTIIKGEVVEASYSGSWRLPPVLPHIHPLIHHINPISFPPIKTLRLLIRDHFIQMLSFLYHNSPALFKHLLFKVLIPLQHPLPILRVFIHYVG